MIKNKILLSTSGKLLDLTFVVGIYRDRNPADKGKVIKHWVKENINNKIVKTLIEGIHHPEYAVIKVAANFNQVVSTYVEQGQVTLLA
jgi:hypothetical protein